MSISEQQQGHAVTVTVEGAEELPILFANAFFVQASGDGTFILTAAQAAPPLFAGTPEEQQRQLFQLGTVVGKPLVRIAVSEAKLGELVTILQGILAGHLKAMGKGESDGSQ